MKKKILLILLSLVIGLCVSVPAFAAQADGFASEYERVQGRICFPTAKKLRF